MSRSDNPLTRSLEFLWNIKIITGDFGTPGTHCSDNSDKFYAYPSLCADWITADCRVYHEIISRKYSYAEIQAACPRGIFSNGFIVLRFTSHYRAPVHTVIRMLVLIFVAISME